MNPAGSSPSSLRRKLMRAIWVTSGAAVCASAVAMLAYEQMTYQPRLTRELNAKADLLSLNLHAALNFNDALAAGENLAAMKSVPEVMLACVFRPDGAVFATYRGNSARLQCQPLPAPVAAQLRFDEHELRMTRPIHYQQDTVGYLQIRYELPSLPSRLAQYAAALGMMAATLLLLALTLSRLLQRMISDPILELAQLACNVTEGGNFQLRATPRSGDEVGQLAQAFNRMLETVKQREDELHDSKALLQAVIDNTPAAVYVKDLQGRFLMVNDYCARLIDRPLSQIIGHSVFEMYGSDYARRYEENDNQAIRQNRAVEQEESAPLPDGVHTYLSVKFPLCGKDGKPYALCGISTDITERKQAQRQLEEYRDQLEVAVASRTAELEIANKELQAFSYSVSHDLRAPLRAIDGFSSMLAEDYADRLDQAGQDYLLRVRRAAGRMSQLIDDMLNLSRVSSASVKTQPTDLSALATAILQELQDLNPQRRCRIGIQPDLVVEADPQLMQIALRNLLENAWKYSGKKDQTIIEFGATVVDGRYSYFVRDHGAGFDMAYADKLFNPFQRLHAKEEFEGTGVGLATVSRVIRRHGGQIWANATPGEGATFYFCLG